MKTIKDFYLQILFILTCNFFIHFNLELKFHYCHLELHFFKFFN